MNKLHIQINKEKLDNATLERITNELIKNGYLEKASSLQTREKVSCFVSVLWTIGGLAYPPILMIAVGSWCFVFFSAIQFELQMQKIRNYCENNS